MQNKLRKNINHENFLWNEEFPCQSLESFSGEYYNTETKILDFQFGPVCANQITVLEASKIKQKSSMMVVVHQNGAAVKNVKRYQPVKNACAVAKFRQLRQFN